MKRHRSLLGWCGLGLTVAAVAGGAYAGKRYAEQNMLAGVLGSGVKAESVQWHWRQAAGCAEQVEIPLPNAKDAQQQALQLYAPKLWFVYDQAALLRKRFVLPRVVIEDALISTSSDRLLNTEVVDIDFGASVQLDSLVELPSDSSAASSELQLSETGNANSTGLSAILSNKSGGLSMPWLDQLQDMCDAVLSEKSLRGRQVSVDADMLRERMQAYFGDTRLQAQRLISEARDIQQQFVNMDNLLRQPQLDEVRRRMEIIRDQLAKIKFDISHLDKRFEDERAQIRSSLLIEKKELLAQADQCSAPPAQGTATIVLAQLIQDQVAQPTRAAVLLADLMRKPLDAGSTGRGQAMRYLDAEQPEFAARSARISGKMEIDGKAWPFKAEGSFEVASLENIDRLAASDSSEVSSEVSSDVEKPNARPERFTHPTTVTKGNAQWHMSVEATANHWELDGRCPRTDGPCTICVTDVGNDKLQIDYLVDHTADQSLLSGKGQIPLRDMLAASSDIQQKIDAFAKQYRAEALLRKFMSDALVVDDQTPETLEFAAQQLQPTLDCEIGDAAVQWLGGRLQTAATACLGDVYREAAMQLENLIASKVNDHQGMMATLRNDTEQYIGAQQDELRRIQAMINSLIEQRQINYQFARQPSDLSR